MRCKRISPGWHTRDRIGLLRFIAKREARPERVIEDNRRSTSMDEHDSHPLVRHPVNFSSLVDQHPSELPRVPFIECADVDDGTVDARSSASSHDMSQGPAAALGWVCAVPSGGVAQLHGLQGPSQL